MKFLAIIVLVGLVLYGVLVQWRQWIIKKENAKFNEAMQKRDEEIAKDKDRLTSVEIRDLLTHLNLSPSIPKLFDKTEDLTHYGFYDCFRPADDLIEGMTQKEQEIVFSHKRYYPLFETMDDGLEFLVYDKTLNGFLRFNPEDNKPLETYEVLTWDGIFVSTLLIWYYEDEHTEEEILKICDLLGLTQGTLILNEMKKIEMKGDHPFQMQIDTLNKKILAIIKGTIKEETRD